MSESGATERTGLTGAELMLVLAVVIVWGTNFAVIPVALAKLPPLLLGALRFALSAIPGIFFLRRPPVRWRSLAGYGLLTGLGQFGLLYIAMRRDISPGLASLVIQSQVFLTIGLAAAIVGERIHHYQWAALALGATGLTIIALSAGHAATPIGLFLTLLAALSWAGANLVVKAAGPVNMLSYVVWASLFATPPLILCALAFEGGAALFAGLRHADGPAWLAVAWQAFANTVFGFGAWSWLLARHRAATITPFALLIPIFGMGASAVFLGEPLQTWKLAAAALVIAGLIVNLFWPRLAKPARRQREGTLP